MEDEKQCAEREFMRFLCELTYDEAKYLIDMIMKKREEDRKDARTQERPEI